jgi:hypothetical protein
LQRSEYRNSLFHGQTDTLAALSGKTSREGAKARREQQKNQWSLFSQQAPNRLPQKILGALAPLREVLRHPPTTMLKSQQM